MAGKIKLFRDLIGKGKNIDEAKNESGLLMSTAKSEYRKILKETNITEQEKEIEVIPEM